jgi:putative dimethyl sulfoxide reductase chaperone
MSQIDMENWKPSLMGEALLFGLLGKTFFEELNKGWLETLISEDVFAEAPLGSDQTDVQQGLELLQRWSAENRTGLSEQEIKALKQDEVNLFIGVDRVIAPLWESVYFNERHLVFQEQTLQVREWYARFGLESERLYREPDDHIGLELIFVAHLATLALNALEAQDHEAFENYLQAQRDFLSEHLLRWGPAWARLVRKNAETDFYRGLAYLTRGALATMAELLEVEIPKEVLL